MRWSTGGIGIVAAAVATAALVLVGCSSGESENPPSAAAVAAALSQSQSPVGSGRSGEAAGPTRRSQGGSVTIDVTWQNPGAGTGPLTFAVVMDTHSVDLDRYDLGKLAVLRNDRGQDVNPQEWDAPLGGHHRSGTLTFPATDASGKPILGAGAKTIELVIRDVAGVKERVLSWQVP